MVAVFVSRPLDIPPEFESGLHVFLRLLEKQGLNPRTLGDSDFSIENPLDAASKLMDECAGAVILGYPQFAAMADNEENSTLKLSSAWNQIEATLAYTKQIPLMIVTHPGVDSGIFDRGAAGRFVFTEELTNPNWPLQAQILGALKSWKESIDSPPVQKRGGSTPEIFKSALDVSELASRLLPAPTLSDDQIAVLKVIAEKEEISTVRVSTLLGTSKQRAQHSIDELERSRLIDYSPTYTGDVLYYLTKAGRSYLFENDLLD